MQNVNRAKQQQSHFEELHTNIKAEQKRHNELLEERKKLEQKIPEWKNDIKLLEKHERIISEQIKNKNLSKIDVENKKKELAKIQKKKDRINNFLSGTIKYGTVAEILSNRKK